MARRAAPRARCAALACCAAACATGATSVASRVDWASPSTGATASSSSNFPLCWGPAGGFSDGTPRYCSSVAAAFDHADDRTFWAEPGGMDDGVPHPSPAAPAWLRVSFAAPRVLRGATVSYGASMNYTLEVAAASPDGPWRVLAAHTCEEDTGCACGGAAAWRGGYDAARETLPKVAEHAFHSGAPVAHARLRITFAGLGGYACGDLCLWSNPIFGLRFWGEAEEEEDVADAAQASLRGLAVSVAGAVAGPAPRLEARAPAGGAAAAACAAAAAS
jgi:hypothetical protein